MRAMRLVHKNTGKPVVVGETVTSFRGEPAVVTGWERPRHAGSTGRVTVKEVGAVFEMQYFPSVFDLEWEHNS